MASIAGLARQVHAIRMKVDPPKPPVVNILASEDWAHVLDVLRSVLPAYPEAHAVVEQAIAGFVAPMSWRQVEDVLVQAMVPFVDARVAVAQALMDAQI